MKRFLSALFLGLFLLTGVAHAEAPSIGNESAIILGKTVTTTQGYYVGTTLIIDNTGAYVGIGSVGTPNVSGAVGILPKANGGTGASNAAVTFPSTGTIPVVVTGTASITPGTVAATTCGDASTTITVTGAVVGDSCSPGTPAAGAGTDIVASCYISASNVAKVRFCNVNGSDQTGTTGTYRATVVH